MPAELKYEMFDSMPLENAFSLLASMSNGLLARNVRNRINGTKKVKLEYLKVKMIIFRQ
jgi:hypothetical protein